MNDDNEEDDPGLAAANRFFDGLLTGNLAALQAACAPGSVLWINLTEQERALEDSLRGFAALRSKVPDLRMEDVRRRGIPGGFLEQHVLLGTLPDGEPLRVAGASSGPWRTVGSADSMSTSIAARPERSARC